MAVNTTEVRNQIAKVAQQPRAPKPPQDTVAQLIESMKGEMAKALPRHVSVDRLARVLLTTLRQQPELLECTRESLLGALMLCAQFGLEPGPLGHVYLVPRKNNKLGGRKEVQFMLGYTGLLELMWRSGRLRSISIHEVYEKDKFEFSYGLDEKLIHVPSLADDRGKIIAYYLVAKYRDGAHFIFVMTPAEVERHRQMSAAKDSGPWVTNYIEMAWKTVLRTAARWMPKSIEVQRALFADEGTVSLTEGNQLEVGHTYEGEVVVQPMPEPEDEPEGEPTAEQTAPGNAGAVQETLSL